MKRLFAFLAPVALAAALAACASHYSVSSVTRERMLIDQAYDGHADSELNMMMEPYTRKVDSLMSPVVGVAAMPIEPYRPESPMSNLLADILVWAGGEMGEKPDFGIYNIGGMRASLAKGNITVGDVNEVAPFENYLCFVTLTGDKVTELLQQVAYRGGEGVSREVRMTISTDNKLLSATVGGAPVDPNRSYRVATLDYVSHGNDRMVAFKSSTDRNDIEGERGLSRNVIMRYIQHLQAQGKPVEAYKDGRITVATKQ